MSMEQFKQTYFEECEDRILEAEQGLASMMEGDHSADTINQVFRAVHSIKGGAGAFAFDKLVGFAHIFETVMDFVREGRIEPDRDLCGLFLRANDIVAGMIECERNGETIDDSLGADVLQELQAVGAKIDGSLAAAGGENSAEAGTQGEGEEGGTKTWSIVFRPNDEILRTGNEPLYIIQALKDLGEVTVTAETDAIPSLDELVPGKCYMGWRILLKTDAPLDEIQEVFLFVEDLCEITIEVQNVPPGDMPERRKAPESTGEQSVRMDRRKEDREMKEVAASTASRSIRVDLDRIDQLVNLVGEMVIAQSMLQEQVRWLPPEVSDSVGEGIENLSRHMRDLQDSVMSVRAQQIKSVFTRMPRIIREVSNACGKDVRLTTFGEDTEVDKTVLENLIDPLTHMIRNSVDHGIEKPADRQAAGKEPYGTIQLSARHKSGRIIIEVEDDGKGINREAVLKKAESQGLVAPDANLTPNEIDNLIFKPGFSTAESVSAVSGRGVGMDVVKRNVTNMGGRITVASNPGKGCIMTLSLPLTLAVMDGMVVSVGSQRFVLPTINIVESFRPNMDSIGRLTNGMNVIRARGEYVRIIPLYNMFRIGDAIVQPDEALVILLESDGGERIAVMVDDVLGQQQVVIKSLETNFTNVEGISAATILGNGDVALILDVPGLTDMKSSIDLKEEALDALKGIKDIEEHSIEVYHPEAETEGAALPQTEEELQEQIAAELEGRGSL